MGEDLLHIGVDDEVGSGADFPGFRLEGDAGAGLAEEADVVGAVADGEDPMGGDAELFFEVEQNVPLADGMVRAAVFVLEDGRKGDVSGGEAVLEAHEVGDAEIGEDAAADDLGDDAVAVADDADAVAFFAEGDDGFAGSFAEFHGAGDLFELSAGNAGEDLGDGAGAFGGGEVVAVEELAQGIVAAGLLGEDDDGAIAEKGAVHVEEGEALGAFKAAGDEGELGAGLAFDLFDFDDLVDGEAAVPFGAVHEGADDLFSHFAEGFESLALVLEVTDIDFGDAGSGEVGVDEEGEVDTVIGLEAELFEEASLDGDDAAEGLGERGDFGEEGLEQGAGRQRGDAAGAAAEAGLDEVGAVEAEGLGEEFDELIVETTEVAVEVDEDVAARGLEPVIHGGTFAEKATGNDAGAAADRGFGGTVNRTVVDDNDLANLGAAVGEGDHVLDIGDFIEGGDDDGNHSSRLATGRGI